ncbi:ubiquitin-conjugating enzyme E2 Z-like [Dermacentor albipictus]|uniref:ubiquitin-conjugating enzyme E2 Z-like n=1 Tax=Dermacentor albipictus TaxID=60249 RepID=UPI0031FD9311
MLTQWDPKTIENQEPTATCLLRVKQDIAEIKANPLPGIYVSPEENDLTKFHAIVVGPSGTPYEGGFFQFFMKCPANYPMQPPRVRLMTTDAGRVRFNPNLYACGKVCLSILGTWPGPAWSPVQSISSVLISIQSLLNEEPYYNEPGFAKGMSPVQSKKYNDNIQHETIRVAVCDMVEACLQADPPCPPDLAGAVLKQFAESYGMYEEKVKGLIHVTGSNIVAGFLGLFTQKITYQYETLLTRLKDLKERVDKKHEAEANANMDADFNADVNVVAVNANANAGQ